MLSNCAGVHTPYVAARHKCNPCNFECRLEAVPPRDKSHSKKAERRVGYFTSQIWDQIIFILSSVLERSKMSCLPEDQTILKTALPHYIALCLSGTNECHINWLLDSLYSGIKAK